MLMILSHVEATAETFNERRFSVDGKLFVENQLFVCKDQLLRDISIIICRVTSWRLMIWILHSIISARKHYFQGQKEGLLGKEKSSKDCQLAELNEEILKINIKAMLLKSYAKKKGFIDRKKIYYK